MSQKEQLVSLVELRRRLPKDGLTRHRIENAIRDGHIRARRGPRSRRGSRRIDLVSARKHFDRVREAIRSGRMTTEAWKDENGVWWLPAGPLAGTLDDGKEYPTRALIAKWWAYGCYLLRNKKKLRGKIMLAAGTRGDTDSLVPTLFIRKSAWNEVTRGFATREAVKSSRIDLPKRKHGDRRFSSPADLRLDPKLWLSTPNALKLIGLKADMQLRIWNREGYATHGGARLPLDCELGGRGDVNYWYQPHLAAIKKYRSKQWSLNPRAIFMPFRDKKGDERIRLRTVRDYMKAAGVPEKDLPSTAGIWLWCPETRKKAAATRSRKRASNRGCGALGGKVLDIIPWRSLNSDNKTEPAVLKSQIDDVIEAYKKPAQEYDKIDFFKDEKTGDIYAPQHLALKRVNSVILNEQRKLPREKRTIEIRRELLPWRPRRKWNKKHYVYSVKDLLEHPKARSTEPLYPAPTASDNTRQLDERNDEALLQGGGVIHDAARSRAHVTAQQPAKEPHETGSPGPRIILRGPKEPMIVDGVEKRVRGSQYNVLKAVIDAGPGGLTKDLLVTKSGHTDARMIFYRMCEDPDLGKVLEKPGQTGGRYKTRT